MVFVVAVLLFCLLRYLITATEMNLELKVLNVTPHIAKDGLELRILLPPHHKFWDYRLGSTHPAGCGAGA